MLPKYIVQIILGISRVFGRAIGKAVKEEYIASQQASKGRNNNSKTAESIYTDLSSSISLEEAKLILNIKDLYNIEDINQKYTLLFENNDKSKGGSLYLQSKVYRAKERIDQEIMNINK